MSPIRWVLWLLGDVIALGWVNRSAKTSAAILFFLFVGLVIGAAQISAPFIYTLF